MDKETPKGTLWQASGPSTIETDDEAVEKLMREVSGFYDQSKVEAFMCCVVDLAAANDMTLLECFNAFKSLLLATEMRMAEKSRSLGGVSAERAANALEAAAMEAGERAAKGGPTGGHLRLVD